MRLTTEAAPSIVTHVVIAAWLTLTLGLALPATANASSNEGTSYCLTGYNYVDTSTGFLFAATSGSGPVCTWVRADIRNPGWVSGVGFADGHCIGTFLNAGQGENYASASATVSPSMFQTPCSNHFGSPAPNLRFQDWGALYFNI